MTTDNKTPAVDVLAVMDLDANHANRWRQKFSDSEWSEMLSNDSENAMAAVAELIEAIEADLRGEGFDSADEKWSDYSKRRRQERNRVANALDRVKGESA
ncbi:hypothetical protein [Stenotrophomonas maltophilia]|uniref:hypothetical protein n=1 Tax=Stenotrophomonas maltophilia TaxID=40324 RepID=UPI0039C45ABD